MSGGLHSKLTIAVAPEKGEKRKIFVNVVKGKILAVYTMFHFVEGLEEFQMFKVFLLGQ